MTEVLDHYYLELRNGCYSVVVGNIHYNTMIIGYNKYCPTTRETIWCSKWTCYERLVPIYNPRVVYQSTPQKTYTPYYGAEVPIIPLSMIRKVFDPVERLAGIIADPENRLEETIAGLAEELMITGKYEGIGVTGSTLAGIHNPSVSDIDLVINSWRTGLGIIEAVEEKGLNLEGFSGGRLMEWCRRNAESTGISIYEACKYYRLWRRGLYRGKEYSIIYNDGIYRPMETSEKWITKAPVIIEAYIEGGMEALNYPSIGRASNYKIIKARGKLRGDIEYVISLEALYIPLFYEGGRAIINGLLQYSPETGIYRVMIGVREHRGVVRWIQ